jgi:hypothetical protein
MTMQRDKEPYRSFIVKLSDWIEMYAVQYSTFNIQLLISTIQVIK